jgi:ceramide glucosyltransferase
MGFSTLLSYLGAIWWILSIAVLTLTICGALLQPFLQARRAKRRDLPPISAVLPIKLVNPGFEAAESSIFKQDYPDYEVLISAAEASSPALDLMQAMALGYSERPSSILQSQTQIAASPKLNNLAAPLASAEHDFVFIKDSNITLAPDGMTSFMQNFVNGVGLVVAIPVAVRPDGFAGLVEAFLINGHARLLMTASALGLGFGVGKVMLFKRSDFARAGGIEAMSYTVAEDTAISKAMATLGLETVFSHRTVEQEIGARNLREIYQRQLRWAVIRRAHEPFSFPLEPLSSPLPAAFAAAFAAPLVDWPAAFAFAVTLLLWFGCEIGVAGVKKWDISIWSPAAFLGRELLSLVVWLRAWTTRDVVWANGRLNVYEGVRSDGDAPEFGKNR